MYIYTHTYVTSCDLGKSQLLSLSGKVKNSGIVQSIRLDVSVVPIWCWSARGCLESCWASVYTGIMKQWVLIRVKNALATG